MIPLTKQNILPQNAPLQFFSPDPPHKLVTITNLKFNNPEPNPYVITIFRGSKSYNKLILLYTFLLDAGDTLNDDTVYFLGEGDSLWGFSTERNVQFALTGYYDTNN